MSICVAGFRRALSSVESAALSGVAAAVLLSVSVYLLAQQPGVRTSAEDLEWYADSSHRFTVFLGLNLAALGVVNFVWSWPLSVGGSANARINSSRPCS